VWRRTLGLRFLGVLGLVMLIGGELVRHGSLVVDMGMQLVGAVVIALLLETRLPLFQIREVQRLPIDELLDRIHAEARYVRILDIWMKSFVSDDFVWPRLQAAIRSALIRGAKIEVLILNPWSPEATRRADELKDVLPGVHVHKEMQVCAARIKNFHRELRTHDFYSSTAAHFRVRLHQQRPQAAMHEVDNDAYWCFYPLRDISARTEQMNVKGSSALGKYLGLHFEALWDDESTIDIADWDERAPSAGIVAAADG
jgi:hypothetical protein